MPTSAVVVDQTLSYARRSAGVYEVVITTEGLNLAGGAQLFLRSRQRLVTVPATTTVDAERTRLSAEIPIAKLAAGPWRLELDGGGEGRVELDARLVVGPNQPVALLTGPKPTSSIRPRAEASHGGRFTSLRAARARMSSVVRGVRGRVRR